MSEFVLNRNYTLQGHGHCINFVKGQPTSVPKCLHKAAAGIGAECADGAVDPLEDEVPVKLEATADERLEQLTTAIALICERNDSDDFGGDNRPTLTALHKIVDFTTSKRELGVAWVAYKAKMAEAE